MIELRLLGPQSVCRSDGREFGSLPAQPKRFALLAFLALGNGALQRRDVIAAAFWPDLDQFAARRALRNTLYHLREALGDGVIATQGDELVGVEPGMITSDIAALREAFAKERFEDAIDLYRGELLAGIHFANAGEAFEEWLAAQRAATLETVLSSMRALIDRDLAAENGAGAAYWASRASALVPGDEALLRQAMTLLDASGDRGGALRKHEAYSTRLNAEFRAKPSSETEELARRIRDGVTTDSPRSPSSERDAKPFAVDSSLVATASVKSTDVVQQPLPRRRNISARVLYGAVALTLAVIVAFAWTLTRRDATSKTATPRVLVTVFDNLTGDPSLQSIGRMTQDWLTQGILRTKLVDVVDQRVVTVQEQSGSTDPLTMAKRSGASMVVSGTYYRSGDSLLFQASVVNVATGRIVRVVGPIVTTTAQPVVAINELRSRVMTALASTVDPRFAQSIDDGAQIPSFDAYQAYIQGYDAFWHGDGRLAKTLFAKSARLDTTFVPAAVSAATAASNYHDCALVDSLQRALRLNPARLSRVDDLSLSIADARCRGQNDQMLRLTLERADLEPRTSSLQLSAAAAALWANRPKRALTILQRLNPETDLGWSVDTTHFAYWSGLTEAYHLLGRHDEELSAATRIPSYAPLNRAWMRGRALAALGRPSETLGLADTIVTLSAETANDIGLGPYTDGRPPYTATAGWVTVWIARELMAHGDPATARKVAARSYAWYRARPPLERETPEERLVASWALDLMGSYAESGQVARALIMDDSTNIDYRGALASPLAAQGNALAADSVDAWLAGRTDVRASWSAAFYRARTAALLGRKAQSVAFVRDALDHGAWPMWIHIDPPIASLASRQDMLQLTSARD
jgi:DNA-binding SARP family transcriptional activator/TolB-like protein